MKSGGSTSTCGRLADGEGFTAAASFCVPGTHGSHNPSAFGFVLGSRTIDRPQYPGVAMVTEP